MPNPRKLLFPFSVLYHAVTGIRNKLYDRNFLKSVSYDFPVIAVGNLNMGGTGKSPMIEYLINILQAKYKVATLSRGYKRKSKGFRLVESSDIAITVGDEPLQFKNKFPKTIVAVDANRGEGIAELSSFSPDIILLDDAFQHRRVSAGFYILLTAFGDLYVDDMLLPAGNLRESSSGAERANMIVVSKCPSDMSIREMDKITARISPEKHQDVFFTTIRYSDQIFSEQGARSLEEFISRDFALVTGIANPGSLLGYLKEKGAKFLHFRFPDHHNFSKSEIDDLSKQPLILTTEKDFMRLKDRLPSENLNYLPIETEFLAGAEERFKEKLFSFIHKK